MRVMVADDNPGVRVLVKTLLEEGGHECLCAAGGAEAVETFRAGRPDVVVLDVMMPKIDGLEVCRRIRELDAGVPVLFLSAKGDITDKRAGFLAGGDDYLVKPFDEEELLIRIDAMWRRTLRMGSQDALEHLALGKFEFDPVRHKVTKSGSPVDLTPKEFQVLYHLARHHGEVIGKRELVESCWGSEWDAGGVNVAAYIRRLRSRVEDDPTDPRYIVTAWGVGYSFEP